MPVYLIMQGVRRAVAAREAGKADVPVVIHDPGKPDVVTRLSLDDLVTTKPSVARDTRYIRYTEYPTLVLGTEPPPIEVQPLGLPGQTGRAIPLRTVPLI